MTTGRTAAAVATSQRALEVRPDDPVILNRLALAHAVDGDLDQSAASYDRAVTLDSSVVDLPDNVFRVLASVVRDDLADKIRGQMRR